MKTLLKGKACVFNLDHLFVIIYVVCLGIKRLFFNKTNVTLSNSRFCRYFKDDLQDCIR